MPARHLDATGVGVHLLVLLCSVLSTALATTYDGPAPDLATMVDAADLIVEGEVQSTYYEYAEDGMALTRHVVRIDTQWMGWVESGTIVVGLPGGLNPDGSFTVAVGAPTLAVGDHVLVVGRAKTEDRIVPVSWRSGVARRVTVGEELVATDGRGRLFVTFPETIPPVVGDVTAEEAEGALQAEVPEAEHPEAAFALGTLVSWDALVDAVAAVTASRGIGASLGGYAAVCEEAEVVP